MRSPAQFGGEFADLHYANALAVLLAEQCHRFELVHGDIDGNVFERLDAGVFQNLAIHQVFDILQLFIGNGCEVREVKAQMSRRHQRSRLLHVLAQRLAQRGMEKMRASVITLGGLAHIGVYKCFNFLP